MARKRLAGVAERRASRRPPRASGSCRGDRRGRRAGPVARRGCRAGRRGAAHRPSRTPATRPTRAADLTATGDRPAIEARLAAAGLPPLRRTAWIEIDLDGASRATSRRSGRWPAGSPVDARRQGRRLRARDGPGRPGARGGRRRRRCASRRSTRRSSSARRGIDGADARPLPDPGRSGVGVAVRRGVGRRVAAAGPRWTALLAAAAAAGVVGGPRRSSSRSRPGSGAAASPPEDVVDVARRILDAGARLERRLDAPPGGGGGRDHGRARSRGSRPRSRRSGAAGDRGPAPPPRRERRDPARERCRATTPSGPG